MLGYGGVGMFSQVSCSVGCGSDLSCCVKPWYFAKCIVLACSGCAEHGFGQYLHICALFLSSTSTACTQTIMRALHA